MPDQNFKDLVRLVQRWRELGQERAAIKAKIEAAMKERVTHDQQRNRPVRKIH